MRPRVRNAAALSVTITGPAYSGRTTLASIIAAALRDAGASVTVDDDEDTERFGPLTGKKVHILVRLSSKSGPAALRLVK